MEPLTVSVKQAMEMTGLSEATIYRNIKMGALPISKVGRRTLIPVASLRSFVGERA